MTSERWQQVEQILNTVLDLEPRRRTAFLESACAGDEELRREVESLLAFTGQAEDFVAAPPDDVAAELLGARAAPPLIGRTLGRYRLTALLGAGGMGEVYRARDLRLDRDVAVKILPADLADNPDALRRFEREAKAVAALSHPNILAIHDFGTEEGRSYAVMELLEGETLRGRLSRAALPWREAVGIAAAVADGLTAAHTKGIIHRDLKPENIFLTSAGGVKILDFGIARVKRAILPDAETAASTAPVTTTPGTIIGTVGYMSPEQVRGEEAEAPSDIFALGCVLFELVSGRRPFARGNTMETLAAILNEDPPVLTKEGGAIPKQVERVIRHCLEKRPAARYQSAQEMSADLRATLSQGRISLPVPALPRPARRSLWWVGATVLMLLLGLGVWWYFAGRRGTMIDSLAVLPLNNTTKDENAEYLSEGFTEAIINSLAQLPQLKRVIARSTMASYKDKAADPRQVGQELNVRAVLTGKLTRRGDDLTIGLELVNSADGARLWGEQYQRKLAEAMSVQAEITRQISQKLRLGLTGEQQQRLAKRPANDPEAHQLYLRGRHHLDKGTEEDFKRAIQYFNQAIDRDPNYALPYVGIATAYNYMSDAFMPATEAMPKVQAAARQALERDETLAEAHALMAYFKWVYDYDWIEGERAFKRAFELNPNSASTHNTYGLFLVAAGRFAEAQREVNRAWELDPLSVYVQIGTVWPIYFARQYDRAIAELQKIATFHQDINNIHLNLGWAYTQKGAYAEAIAELSKAKSLDNGWINTASLGYAYAKAGQRDEARKLLNELRERAGREYISGYGLAILHTALGEKDLAFATLQDVFQKRDSYLFLLKVDPFFDDLRSDAKFTELLQRLNFPL